MSMIEGLESRLVFAATGFNAATLAVMDDPAVAQAAADVTADRAAVDAARANVVRVKADGKAKLRAVAVDGKSKLADARRSAAEELADAVDAKAVRAELRAALAATKVDVRSAIKTAKAEVKSAAADARTELKQALADLKADLKQLKIEVKAATAAERQKLEDDVQAVADRSGITDEQVTGVVDRVRDLLKDATAPTGDAVRSLVRAASDALDDGTLTQAEQDKLAADLSAALGTNVSSDEVKAIADDVRAIIEGSNLTADDVRLIAGDLRDLARAFFGG